ncbi:SCO family protein [Niveispirillum irakense]|uniref:SCO family protein n=1 Tax=Niveispirillum irakense TaxID=34011 RepID=UPI00048A8ADE|nr:SCO family protein [Niveispirillum irakense]
MKRPFLLGIAALAAALALLAGTVLLTEQMRPGSSTADGGSGRADIGGPFTLTDHTGAPVTEAALQGQVSLVYFGYSFCPDICPTDLQVIGETLDLVQDDLPEAQGLFITVDPERDTQAQLAGYVSLFHPHIRGLTGTPEQVAAAAKVYRAYYKKVSAEEAGSSDYLMDHSAFIYLFDRQGQFVRVFGHGAEAAAIAEAMRALK